MTHYAISDSLTRFRPIESGNRPLCLFVGTSSGLRRAGEYLPAGLTVEHCEFFDVAYLVRYGRIPDFVLSFAISPQFDCLDLAEILKLTGFRGRQRIIDRELPAPAMICREVRLACPGIDFGVLELAELRPV